MQRAVLCWQACSCILQMGSLLRLSSLHDSCHHCQECGSVQAGSRQRQECKFALTYPVIAYSKTLFIRTLDVRTVSM